MSFLRLLFALVLLAFLSACAPVCDGEIERMFNRTNNDQLTQIEGRQDYRTFRQRIPAFLVP